MTPITIISFLTLTLKRKPLGVSYHCLRETCQVQSSANKIPYLNQKRNPLIPPREMIMAYHFILLEFLALTLPLFSYPLKTKLRQNKNKEKLQ